MSEKSKILIVDDNSENIRVLLEILKRDYKLNAATEGMKALELAVKWEPDLILLDVVMPGMNGYDVCLELRANAKTKHIPVVFISAIADVQEEIACIKVGALDYMRKPINPELLKEKIKNYVPIKKERSALVNVLESRCGEGTAHADVLHRSMSALEFRHSYIGKNHIGRCVSYVRIMINALISKPRYKQLAIGGMADMIITAVPYHDIGKALLPDEIILKPGKLTSAQFDQMKTHVIAGAEFVSDIFTDEAQKEVTLNLIRYHHERWDGTGYPEGLSGKNIPLCAQLMALADQYDALTTRRIYREPSLHFEAVRIISTEIGRGFDPDLAYEFLDVHEKFLEINKRCQDEITDYKSLINFEAQ